MSTRTSSSSVQTARIKHKQSKAGNSCFSLRVMRYATTSTLQHQHCNCIINMKFHSLSFAVLATNSASGSVYASASDEPSTSTQSSLRGMFLNEDEASASASMRELKRGGDDDGKDSIFVCLCLYVCGLCELSLLLLSSLIDILQSQSIFWQCVELSLEMNACQP